MQTSHIHFISFVYRTRLDKFSSFDIRTIGRHNSRMKWEQTSIILDLKCQTKRKFEYMQCMQAWVKNGKRNMEIKIKFHLLNLSTFHFESIVLGLPMNVAMLVVIILYVCPADAHSNALLNVPRHPRCSRYDDLMYISVTNQIIIFVLHLLSKDIFILCRSYI